MTNQIFGGWQVAGGITPASWGNSFTVLDDNSDGQQRPDLAGNPNATSLPSPGTLRLGGGLLYS